MKALLIGLLFLGLTTLLQAQIDDEPAIKVETVDLDYILIAANSKYVKKVSNQKDCKLIKDFQELIANFDITSLDRYDLDTDNYLVNFLSEHGARAHAYYDSEGIISNSREAYKNLRLPIYVIRWLSIEYPGWVLNSSTYLVAYNDKGLLIKMYKMQVLKDGKRKNLKFNGNTSIVSNNK